MVRIPTSSSISTQVVRLTPTAPLTGRCVEQEQAQEAAPMALTSADALLTATALTARYARPPSALRAAGQDPNGKSKILANLSGMTLSVPDGTKCVSTVAVRASAPSVRESSVPQVA